MAEQRYRENRKYKVVVKVTYTIEIPVDGRDEDEAVDGIEVIVNKHDDYEIVNRSSNRSMEIVNITEVYGK